MNPDETLQQLRDALVAMGEPDGDAAWYKDNAKHIDSALQSARDLDEWLSGGGVLPSDWAGNRNARLSPRQ